MPSSLDMSGRSFFGDLAMSDILAQEVSISEAHSLRDYLFVRRLRNKVRMFMTNHTDEIGYVKQLRFFVTMRFGNGTPVKIFIARSNSRPAAYLLVRAAPDGARITEAVAEEFRRLGIARKLIEFAQQRWPDLVAEIREDNEA